MDKEEKKKQKDTSEDSSNRVIEIINGGIFSNRFVTRNLSFFVYIAILVLLYMVFNNVYDNYAYKIKVNETRITNLTSDYNSRNAELLRYSRKDTIKEELIKKNSDLIEPVLPPIIINREK